MSTRAEQSASLRPLFQDEPSLGRIRAALVQHRRRLDESERAFRQWQARWWLRERVIEQQIRRVQLQLAGLPPVLTQVRALPERIRPGLRSAKPVSRVVAVREESSG